MSSKIPSYLSSSHRPCLAHPLSWTLHIKWLSLDVGHGLALGELPPEKEVESVEKHGLSGIRKKDRQQIKYCQTGKCNETGCCVATGVSKKREGVNPACEGAAERRAPQCWALNEVPTGTRWRGSRVFSHLF